MFLWNYEQFSNNHTAKILVQKINWLRPLHLPIHSTENEIARSRRHMYLETLTLLFQKRYSHLAHLPSA